MEKSDIITDIATAICKFQGAVEKIRKEANNPFFKKKYASLANILDVIRQPLFENGLSFVQFPTGENELTTMIMHTTGQYISDTYTMRPVKNDPQGLGSCITYMRRYALGAILGLNIDEDDDANKASGLKEKDKSSVPEKIVKQQAPAPKPPSDDYINGVINTLDPDADSSLIVILDEINRATNVAMLSTIFSTYQDLAQNIDFKNCLTHKKNEIKAK